MAKVKLSKEEFEHVTRVVSRVFKHREALSRQDANKEKKSSYSLVKGLYNKLFSELYQVIPADGVVVKLSRQEVRFLESLIKSTIGILEGHTIPGYMKRIDDGEEVDKHKDYLNRAIEMRDNMLNPLLKKIQGAL